MVLKLINEIWKAGKATHPYPFAPVDLAPGFRGRPEFDPEQCIACGACTVACSPNALAIENDLTRGVRTWSLFYGRCIYCARCEEVCPTGAIHLGPEFESAVFNRADLFVKAEFQLAACCQCGAYFAPAKELVYLQMLLDQAGDVPLGGERRELAMACPECRRKADLPKVKQWTQEVWNGRG